MASACVNNIGISPPTFPSFACLSPSDNLKLPPENPDAVAGDFEFGLEDPVAMLTADELFSDGKLVPLQLKPSSVAATGDSPSPEKPAEPFMFSPKAPRCSSRWRELLGLKKKLCSNNNDNKPETPKTTSFSSTKSLKHFLNHRGSKTTSFSSSSENASLSLPLLKDSESESVCVASRLSLSSSSSGHDHEDLPRLSLDSEKPGPNPNPNPNQNTISLHRNPNAHPRMRHVKARAGSFDNSHVRRAESGAGESRGVSVDSPRMNSSGKIVFQSLERSSSSPSSFNGGPRFKHRGMERSYSANVRVTPVLNVPVCSLRGSSKTGSVFGFFSSSSPQKKEGTAGGGGGGHRGSNGGSKHRN